MKLTQEAETQYYAENMKREAILQCLRDKGCRITKQREVLMKILIPQLSWGE